MKGQRANKPGHGAEGDMGREWLRLVYQSCMKHRGGNRTEDPGPTQFPSLLYDRKRQSIYPGECSSPWCFDPCSEFPDD